MEKIQLIKFYNKRSFLMLLTFKISNYFEHKSKKKLNHSDM